jgi:hypothetical protein
MPDANENDDSDGEHFMRQIEAEFSGAIGVSTEEGWM